MPQYDQGDIISSFQSPSDIGSGVTVDTDGCLWHADQRADTIYKLTRDGSVQSSFATPDSEPEGIGIDSDGCLWHADENASVIYKLTQTGSIQSSFETPGSVRPLGVGVDSAGCVWFSGLYTDGSIYKADQNGTVGASFAAPSITPYGIGFDGDGCLWHSDDQGSIIYQMTQAGTIVQSINTPSDFTRGLGVDRNDTLWVSVGFDRIDHIAHDDLGLSPASQGSVTVTPTDATVTASATVTVTQTTVAATGAIGTQTGTVLGTASRPTVGISAGGSVATQTDAAGDRPTATVAGRTTREYADVPLIDGEPVVEDVAQRLRWDELDLDLRVDQATLDAVVRSLEVNTGDYELLDAPDGGFTVADTTATTPDNTFRYAPRYAEYPVVEAQDIHIDSYSERPAATDAAAYRVTVTAKWDSNRQPETGVIDETAGADDWSFETSAGTIATKRVQRNVEAESDAGTLGFVLDVWVDQQQAHALRVATGHQGAVGTVGAAAGEVDAVDNSPDDSNYVTLDPRDTSQLDATEYLVRDLTLERQDPGGTWYRAQLELVQDDLPPTGRLGAGAVGDSRLGDST